MSKVFEALSRFQKDRNPGNDTVTAGVDEPTDLEMAGLEGVIGAPEQSRSSKDPIEEALHRSSTETPLTPLTFGQVSAEAVPQALSDVHTERVLLSRLHSRLIVLTEPESPECEQFRTLRTRLFHASEIKNNRIITLTSALAGEGKTSTLLNLALAISQSNEKRVLVIDGDLRRPNISAYLGIRPKSGLAEAITGSADLPDVLCRLEEPPLYVLPVTNEAGNPTELLSSDRLLGILSEVRDWFDYILIDSPPVMPFADARLLANHSDSVIVVIRAGMATYETIEKAVDLLPAERILGVVLNGAEHEQESGYYDYYYNYNRQTGDDRSLRNRFGRIMKWIGRV